MEPGTKYDSQTDTLVWDEATAELDKTKEVDARTVEVLREVANSIHPMITMEEDYPSKHSDKKLPILDLKCWFYLGQVWYQHYEKPVSTRTVLMAKSGYPMSKKRQILVNECLRRLLHCREELPWSYKTEVLEDYMARLRDSGYSEQFRRGVLKQAIGKYETMLERQRTGERPLHRSRDYRRSERQAQKTKKTSWIAKGGHDTVMMVPATPNSELAKAWKKVIEENPGPVKIKVVEEGGRSLVGLLRKSNPTKPKGCTDSKCLPCKFGRGEGGECRRNNVGYYTKCEECDVVVKYVGETGRNGYTRGLNHVDDYRRQREDSHMWKHAIEKHERRMDVKFSMKIVKDFKDPLTRQVNEAVRMVRCEADNVLNSKSEWHGPAIVRLVPDD